MAAMMEMVEGNSDRDDHVIQWYNETHSIISFLPFNDATFNKKN
jgi:hypothetical protein